MKWFSDTEKLERRPRKRLVSIGDRVEASRKPEKVSDHPLAVQCFDDYGENVCENTFVIVLHRTFSGNWFTLAVTFDNVRGVKWTKLSRHWPVFLLSDRFKIRSPNDRTRRSFVEFFFFFFGYFKNFRKRVHVTQALQHGEKCTKHDFLLAGARN